MRFGPHLRYFVRALLLLVPIFAVWWTLLLDPMLEALRWATQGVFRVCLPADPPAQVAIEPAGGWFFRVPVPAPVARRPEIQRMFGRVSPATPYIKVRSLRLEIPARDPALFVVSLPFFWAMVLAVEFSRRTLRALAAGTVLLLPLAVVLLVFDVVRNFVVNTHLAISAFAAALLHSGDMASLNVIPYLAPLLLAFILHSGLRSLVFAGEAEPVPAPAASPSPGPARPGRAAKRPFKPSARKVSLGSE